MHDAQQGCNTDHTMVDSDRAAYELGHLLRYLPAELASHEVLTGDTRMMAITAEVYVRRSIDTIIGGIEILGKLAANGAIEENAPSRDVALIGDLVNHLAVQLQFLREVDDDLRLGLRLPVSPD